MARVSKYAIGVILAVTVGLAILAAMVFVAFFLAAHLLTLK
jgi:hypothetical protein